MKLGVWTTLRQAAGAGAVVALALGLGACAVSTGEGETDLSAEHKTIDGLTGAELEGGKEPEQVGYVKMVPEAGGFVLVRVTESLMLPSGSVLRARDPSTGEETAELRLSPERRPGFFVADLTGGEASEGDIVFTDPTAEVGDLGLTPLVQGAAGGGLSEGEVPPIGEDNLFWPAFGDEIPDPKSWGWKPGLEEEINAGGFDVIGQGAARSGGDEE